MIHQITRNRTLPSLQQSYGKMWIGFCFNTETHLIADISKNVQLKKQFLLQNCIRKFWNSSELKRSASFYNWATGFQTVLLRSNLTIIFLKKAILFRAVGRFFMVGQRGKLNKMSTTMVGRRRKLKKSTG